MTGTFNNVAELFQAETGVPFGTVKSYIKNQRSADLLQVSKRGRGAVACNSGDAITILIGTALADSNSKAAETARRVLALPIQIAVTEALGRDTPVLDQARESFRYLSGLGISSLDTFGAAATSLLDAMRSGTFDVWCAGILPDITIEFHNGKCAVIAFLPGNARGVFLTFGQDDPHTSLSRITRINDRLLWSLADMLGPLPEAVIPPPPL